MSKNQQTLEKRKRYAAYIGDQEMDTVEFKYVFKYVDADTGDPRVTIEHNSDCKLTPREAWDTGREFEPTHAQDSSYKELIEVREIVIASGEVERPQEEDAQATEEEIPSEDGGDAPDVPEDPPPAPRPKRGC